MKQVIKLTESDLHRIIKESVSRIINEAVLANETYYCPECGHEFVQGESHDGIYELGFECPECGWYGTSYDLEHYRDDDTDDWDDDYDYD